MKGEKTMSTLMNAIETESSRCVTTVNKSKKVFGLLALSLVTLLAPAGLSSAATGNAAPLAAKPATSSTHCEDRTYCLRVLRATYDSKTKELTVEVQNTCSESVAMGICYSPTRSEYDCSFAQMWPGRVLRDTGRSENNRYHIKGSNGHAGSNDRCITTIDSY